MKASRIYHEIYRRDPEFICFCPYRISPLGAHIDHQLGKINGFAIDRGIHIACSPKTNGVVELQSLQFDKRAQFHIASVPETRTGDWADHCRGAARQLAARYRLNTGLSGVIEGTLPIGGLSSSAAVIIVFLTALARVNDIRLDPWETIMMAKAAENEYVGVNCGKLDQSCEVLCRRDHLLYMDCSDDSYTLIPKNPAMKPFTLLIFFSGLERSLASSAYNLRQDECKAAAYNLLAFAGLPYGKFKDTVLRNVPYPVFEEYAPKLPDNFRKRAEHFFGEIRRAESGAEAWKNGDLDTYGQLVFQSGESSIRNYECGCPELITLYNIMTRTPGIYGGRFSGAGFKGCCMALADPDAAEDILARVEREYLAVYPNLEGKYLGTACGTSDGADLTGGVRR